MDEHVTLLEFIQQMIVQQQLPADTLVTGWNVRNDYTGLGRGRHVSVQLDLFIPPNVVHGSVVTNQLPPAPTIKCADVKLGIVHPPHWKVIRAENITFAQGECPGYQVGDEK